MSMNNTVLKFSDDEADLLGIIHKAASNLGQDAYMIGGYVRDKLLEKETQDIDIVTEGDGVSLAHEVSDLLADKPKVTVYKKFGTALIHTDEYEIEFVGARKESYRSDSRKPDIRQGTIEDDQRRRDFTINAMSVKLDGSREYQVIDPFNGIEHLRTNLLKTPLEPQKTFSDDPLRMMRAVRFASQLNFDIDKDTYDAILENAGRLTIISQERITTELNKIMNSPKPSVGLILLLETGLFHHFFPEVVKLYGVEEKNGKAHKDNFYHTMQVVDNVAKLSDNLWLRWAALLHDIGKPDTKRYKQGAGWTFHGHDALGAQMVKRIFRKLRLPLDHKMKYVKKLVLLHLRPIALTHDNITDSAVRRLLYDAGDDIDDLMLLCSCDITSKNPYKVKRYRSNYDNLQDKLKEIEEKDKMRNWQPPITGKEIMDTFNLKPSKEVGIIKGKIREAIIEGDIPNNYEAAHAYMLELGNEMNLNN